MYFCMKGGILITAANLWKCNETAALQLPSDDFRQDWGAFLRSSTKEFRGFEAPDVMPGPKVFGGRPR